MVSDSTRRAFRAMSAVFIAVGLFVSVLFVRALGEREIRTGLFTYGALCVASAVGLWRVRRWGRSLALVMAIGNAGLGTLALLAVLISQRGSYAGPALLLVVAVTIAYLLSRPAFTLPEDMGAERDA